MRCCDGEIRNVANACGAILPGGDIADDLALFVGNENAGRIAGHVFIDVTRLAPTPIMMVDEAKPLFDAVIDGNADEALDGEAFQMFQVGWFVESYLHSLILDFGF